METTKEKELNRRGGMAYVRMEVGQNQESIAHEMFGPDATPVDVYVANIKDVMVNYGITVQEAREALKDVREGSYLKEVLEAIDRIETEEKEEKK